MHLTRTHVHTYTDSLSLSLSRLRALSLFTPHMHTHRTCLAIDSRALLALLPVRCDDAHAIHAADLDCLSWQGDWCDTAPRSFVERLAHEVSRPLIAQIEIPAVPRACPMLLFVPCDLGRPGQGAHGVDTPATAWAVSMSWGL